MSDRGDLHANPDIRDLNGVTLWEGLQALEAYERSEGRICTANVIARAFGTLQATAHPNNDTLNNLGAFDRKTKIDKHSSTNWGYLRRLLDKLDAAGQSDVADVIVWQVWWRVNTEARRQELHRCDIEAVASAHAQHVAAEERADAAESELARWSGLTEAVQQITGEPEGWPSHGNAPLAIAAKMQLMQMETAQLREMLMRISSQYVENRGDMPDAEALAAIKTIADRVVIEGASE